MRFLLIIFILFSLSACSQQAQEISEKNIIGYVDLIMDGKETRFSVITMPKEGRSFATLKEYNAENNISRIEIAGVTLKEDKSWEFPRIEFSVQSNNLPFLQGIFIRYLSEKPFDPFLDDYVFIAGTRFETAKISNLIMGDNGLVEFEFSGQLTHSDRNPETGETTPQKGKDPVEISGKVSVVIPAEFRQ